jgi:hypothetical protein
MDQEFGFTLDSREYNEPCNLNTASFNTREKGDMFDGCFTWKEIVIDGEQFLRLGMTDMTDSTDFAVKINDSTVMDAVRKNEDEVDTSIPNSIIPQIVSDWLFSQAMPTSDNACIITVKSSSVHAAVGAFISTVAGDPMNLSSVMKMVPSNNNACNWNNQASFTITLRGLKGIRSPLLTCGKMIEGQQTYKCGESDHKLHTLKQCGKCAEEQKNKVADGKDMTVKIDRKDANKGPGALCITIRMTDVDNGWFKSLKRVRLGTAECATCQRCNKPYLGT